MTALVLSLGARCLVGQEMTTAQMACCAATDHDCGAAVAEDCCQSERAEQTQLLQQVQPPVPPLALVASTIPALVPLVDSYDSVFDVNTTQLKAASPPKYVLLGSFLI